jgi:tRNA 2-thiocytidine biosynthesis protein TtcA
VHTLFLNLLFGGKLKAMPPKLVTDDGAHVVIRPLAYCGESDIAKFARGMEYPIIPCNLCGSQKNLQRQKIREMMADWDQRYPGRTESVFTALQNIVPSHLADNNLFDFKGLRVGNALEEMDGGDMVFDEPQLADKATLPSFGTFNLVNA